MYSCVWMADKSIYWTLANYLNTVIYVCLNKSVLMKSTLYILHIIHTTPYTVAIKNEIINVNKNGNT